MRKTMKKKLSLHRETLHALEEGFLLGVAGGVTTPKTCAVNCTDTCPTICGVKCTL
jgi:hypothetical protein